MILTPEKLDIKRVTLTEWKSFDQSLNAATDDVFMIELSDRLSDAFFDPDPENDKFEYLEEGTLDGIYIEGKLVGLIDYGDSQTKTKEPATIISFILVHPDYHSKGIGKSVVKRIIEESPHRYITMYPCSHASKVLCTQLGFEFDVELFRNFDYRVYKK